MALVACGSAPSPSGSGDAAATQAPVDLIVWQASPPLSVWLRDGREVARRDEVVVAAGGELWAIGYRDRTVVTGHRCEDGCDDCDRPRPPPVLEQAIVEELVAVPLGGGAAHLLATQTTQDDVSCGVAGSRPELLGGMEARVSVAWAEGSTTSAAVGEESSHTGAVFELSALDPVSRVPLASPAGFDEAMRERLEVACAPDDAYCRDGAADDTLVGPLAFRMASVDPGGDPAVTVTAVVARDRWGIDGDESAELAATTEGLGLGTIAPDAIVAADAVLDASFAWGYSHPRGSAAERDALLTRFRAR